MITHFFLSFQARDTCPSVRELRTGETAIQLPEVDSPNPLPGPVRVRGLPPGPEPLSLLKYPEPLSPIINLPHTP